MTSTNRSADTFSSSKSTFTLLELKRTLAFSTPGSFFNTPSIRVIQLGQVSVSNWNLFVFNVFGVFIFKNFIRYWFFDFTVELSRWMIVHPDSFHYLVSKITVQYVL